MFKGYLHIERFGNTEVEGIELGEVYIFPKLDGTNASVWTDRAGCFSGSRTRELSLESDNAGFCAYILNDVEKDGLISSFMKAYPRLRLYGEWLVPHTFKGYREEAWRRFWIFDVYNDETEQYLPYKTYQPLLEAAGLDYIPPLAIVRNGDYGKFMEFLDKNLFMCPDGGTPGEGVVIKNYDYYNKFNRQAFAKIIRQEFKDQHHRVMGAPEINTGLMNEERILDKALTQALVDKTYAKIVNEKDGWSSRYIPELFGRCYYDIVREELWDSLKEINYGTVNFKTLKALMIQRIKKMKPELF